MNNNNKLLKDFTLEEILDFCNSYLDCRPCPLFCTTFHCDELRVFLEKEKNMGNLNININIYGKEKNKV